MVMATYRDMQKKADRAMSDSRWHASAARQAFKEGNVGAGIKELMNAALHAGQAEAWEEAADQFFDAPYSKSRDGKIERSTENVERIFDDLWDKVE